MSLFFFTILYSDWIFLDFLIYSNYSACMIYTRIAFPHFKFHTEEKEKNASSLFKSARSKEWSSLFSSKTSFIRETKQQFLHLQDKDFGIGQCVVLCARVNSYLSRGNTSNACRVHYRKKIFPQRVKVTGIHYNVALFQETVSEYYFFFF